MIKKISRLLRIKEMKEEEALRALQAKRRELANAELDLLKAEEAVDESRKTYEAREDSIYQPILGVSIKQSAIDQTKAKVIALANAHQELIDDVIRMSNVIQRLKVEVQSAVGHHARCVRIKDKYVYIRSTMIEQKSIEEAAREDAEIEELFAKPLRKVG